MDVLSSISLVASIASLVDFGVRLTKSAVEISRSADGSLETNRELETITTRIDSLSEALGSDNIGVPSKGYMGRANYDADIRDLARRSQVVSKDLLLHLASLKARKDRRWYDNPTLVIRTWRGRERLKALKENLGGLQQALRVFLAVETRYTYSLSVSS